MRNHAAALRSLACGIALTASLPAAMGAGPADPSNVAIFGDWLAACDNVLTCTALALPLEEGGSTKTSDLLRFERPAGPNGSVAGIAMNFGESVVADLEAIEFRVDGKPILTTVQNTLSQVKLPSDALRNSAETPSRALYLDHPGIALLIDAMMTGETLEIAAGRGIQQGVSLSGLERALRWIDEQQDRVATKTAFVARGDMSPLRVPEAQPLPVVRRAGGHASPLDDADAKRHVAVIRQRVAQEVQPAECDGLNGSQDADSFVAFAFVVDARLAVVAVRCGVSGAYNHVAALHGVDRLTKVSRPISIERNEAVVGDFDGNPGAPIVVNVGFDPANLRLWQYSAGRGAGDCGNYAEWVWNGERFALALHRSMPTCRGADRGDWPVAYRARVE